MNVTQRNRVVGLILLAIAVTWTVLVYMTVPLGHDGPIGPRDFPLLLGICLAALAAFMAIWPGGGDAEDEPAAGATAPQPAHSVWQEVRVAGGMFLLIILYGFLMQKLGFLIATLIVVTLTLVGFLGERRPVFLALFAIGVSVGSWLIFGKLLGAYLPVGSWYSIG